MKKYMTILVGLLMTTALKAQTWEEWFDQQQTQLQYLHESLSALRAYGTQVAKGYEVVQQGLSLISSLKEGDYRLHQERLSSFCRVAPVIRSEGYAEESERLLSATRQVYSQLVQTLEKSNQVTPAELAYHKSVYAGLLKGSEDLAEEVGILLQGEVGALSDAERIRHLEALTADLHERCAFARRFAAASLRLALQRYREARDVNSAGLQPIQ